MLSNPGAQNRSQSRPERIGDKVGHAGVSGRKKCLQDFDGQTDRESERNREQHRVFWLFASRKNSEEEKSERNKPRDIDANILPVVPVLAKFIPGSFEKLFMQNKEPFWDEEVGRRIYLVVDNVPFAFIEEIERNRTLVAARFTCCRSSSFRNAVRLRRLSAHDRKWPVPFTCHTSHQLSLEHCQLSIDPSDPDWKT